MLNMIKTNYKLYSMVLCFTSIGLPNSLGAIHSAFISYSLHGGFKHSDSNLAGIYRFK